VRPRIGGQPYFDDAMDALRAHQEGRYASDEELAALYMREGPPANRAAWSRTVLDFLGGG
jgi:hypothetical protein